MVAAGYSRVDVLDKLQATLRNLNQLALTRLHAGDALQMHRERLELLVWVEGGERHEVLPLQTIELALRYYQQYRSLNGLRQIQMVCQGVTQHVEGRAVIENDEAFEKLLQYVDYYRGHRRAFRRLYRALLDGYFSYDVNVPDADPVGRENWQKLRKFLAGYLDSFVVTEFSPDWLVTLHSNPDLLEDNPGLSLDSAVLQGEWTVFNEVRECLGLDAGSWLVRRLVMSPVRAVEQMDDVVFRDHLNGLLLLLSEYPLFAAEGLTILLDRYARCQATPTHGRLRDFATGLWGNPWLPDNAHKWQCSAPARALQAHWLKRQLLAEFFSLFCNDDKAHPRRQQFWDLYSEDMKGMYFALGQEAYVLENQHFYKFRSHAKGLIARLTEQRHGVHTCIMQFERYHVVEFNREKNVAYFYDTRQGTPSFYFGKGWMEIGAIGVQGITQGADVGRAAKQLRHQDGHLLTWEGGFARELGMTANALRAFCRKYRCGYEERNGCLWIRPERLDKYGRQVWSVLNGWGFDFDMGSESYFRKI